MSDQRAEALDTLCGRSGCSVASLGLVTATRVALCSLGGAAGVPESATWSAAWRSVSATSDSGEPKGE